jgi:hypothetical protein
MDIRERHIGPISTPSGEGGVEIQVDVGALVRRLLLFEHCTIESNHLRELPELVRVFGPDGLQALLESKAVSIICDALTSGSVGQNRELRVTQMRGGPLPAGSYRIVPVAIADHADYVHNALQIVHSLPGTNLKKQIKIKQQIVSRIKRYPSDVAVKAKDGFHTLLEREDWSLRSALNDALQRSRGINPPGKIRFEVEDLGNDGDFRVATNLSTDLGVSEEESHRIVEQALLAVSSLEQRLELMKAFESLSGFRDAEAQIFASRAAFLAAQLDPDAQEARFDKVTTIAGLPSLDRLNPGERIDVEKLLKLRDTQECRDLRKWLRGIDTETDAEIEAYFASLRSQAAAITHSKAGKAVRFITGNAVGFIPVVGLAAGPAYAACDAFFIEKLIGKPGPASFLGKSYKSIFET